MQPPAKRKAFVAPRFARPTRVEDAPTQQAADKVHLQQATAEAMSVEHQQCATLAAVQPMASVASARLALKPLTLNKQAASKPAVAHRPLQDSVRQDRGANEPQEYFSVLYIKRDAFLKKKLAKAYLDGILCLSADNTATLQSLDNGKVASTGKVKRVTLSELTSGWGQPSKKKGKKAADSDDEDDDGEDDIVRYTLGSFVVEVQQPIAADSYRSGACFAKAPCGYSAAVPATLGKTTGGFKSVVKTAEGATTTGIAASNATNKPRAAHKPLHDPTQPGAIVLNADECWMGVDASTSAHRVANAVPVVIDPYLGRHMRPHQVEGVQFMYDCVMGRREPGQSGCVLADEMGLGKTLQVLTLVWTLLRQGPSGKPVAKKAIVVTPATLCGNWEKEVRTWLGSERMQVFMLGQQQDAKERVQQFKHGTVTKLCITSYETLRKHAADLAGVPDLLVCDEGHRLKAIGGSKTTEALLQLGCPQRILLTGTPVQNNLEEFYALVSFVAPDLLGAPGAFRRVYADPIARAQERDACEDVRLLGADRAAELNRKVAGVLLRRTQAILTKHLPALTNYVVFVKPTQTQIDVYQAVLKKVLAGLTCGGGQQDDTLGAITALKKICNHPCLLASKEKQDTEPCSSIATTTATAMTAAAGSKAARAPSNNNRWVDDTATLKADDPDASGKMKALRALMIAVMNNSSSAVCERVVIVSTSTAALDAVDRLCCQPMGLRTVRIDGSTGVDERQSIVDSFNNRGVGQVFLLSTRAGGAGLNLIGANHLVLFDSDWNPAADLQAMARIWRDGQKRACHVWRLLTAGTIEEKIYQRQIMKGSLASATVAAGEDPCSIRHFTREDLRALFVLTCTSKCQTRDLLGASPSHVTWHEPVDQREGTEGSGLLPALRAVLSCGQVVAASKVVKSDELELAAVAAAADPTKRSCDGSMQHCAQDSHACLLDDLPGPDAGNKAGMECGIFKNRSGTKRKKACISSSDDESVDLPSTSDQE